MSDSNPAPHGLLIEGILDGRTTAPERLEQATVALSQCGAGTFRCDITGGRFTLMPRETHVPAQAFDEDAQERFLAALQAVVQAATADSVESNLRCRVLYADEVAETLFVVRGTHVEPMTRRRPRVAADDEMLTATAAPTFTLPRRQLLLLVPLLLLLAALGAWQSGWIDRVLAARAESLTVDQGPFGSLLTVEPQRTWGNYRVTLRRGSAYPVDAKQLAEQRDRLEALTERAACELVGNGGDLFVQLLDQTGKVLAETRVELRPLLGDADGAVQANLPGRMLASTVRLSLSAEQKSR